MVLQPARHPDPSRCGQGGKPSIGSIVSAGLPSAAAGDGGAYGGELFNVRGGEGEGIEEGDEGGGDGAEAAAGEAIIIVREENAEFL